MRRELKARGLSSVGSKTELIKRLQEVGGLDIGEVSTEAGDGSNEESFGHSNDGDRGMIFYWE